MRRIILMGSPGSGKSTQGQKLAEYMGCPWVSTGEILRKSTEPWVIEKLKTAELFDDEMICKLVRGALGGIEDAVLDGFPRTKRQAEVARELGVTQVIELAVPEEEIIKRLADRGRDQDKAEVVKERLGDYQRMRDMVLAELKGIKYSKIDGQGSVEEVFKRVKKCLEEGALENVGIGR